MTGMVERSGKEEEKERGWGLSYEVEFTGKFSSLLKFISRKKFGKFSTPRENLWPRSDTFEKLYIYGRAAKNLRIWC